MKYFDKDEKKIIQNAKKSLRRALKDGSLVEDLELKKKLQQAATQYLEKEKKSQNINLRITPGDLAGIKEIAAEKGMPYQTLISSVLHQYIRRERGTG